MCNDKGHIFFQALYNGILYVLPHIANLDYVQYADYVYKQTDTCPGTRGVSGWQRALEALLYQTDVMYILLMCSANANGYLYDIL